MRRFLRVIALYAFHVLFARPIVLWLAGVRYRRRNLVPRGPCIVVSNHNSHLDAAVLMGLFPLRRLPSVHPVAAVDYFGSTHLRRTMALLFMNAVPIQRRPTGGKDPLAPVIGLLEAGESLILFPEGSRGEAGVVTRFRPGIGRIVRQVPGVLVVPVHLSGPERIWPRGEYVPVPLNIDAVVGRPRAYDPELAPREIAEQLQRDVLSLAPPAPPPPGAKRPPAVHVAVCGLDSAARAECFDALTARLGELGPTLGISDRLVEAGPDGLQERTEPIPQARSQAWTRLLAAIFRTGRKFQGRKFGEMIERAQIHEALARGRASRYVVTDGSALVDLAAWALADFYRGVFDEAELNRLLQYLSGTRRIPFGKWWKYLRKAREVWLVNEFALARPPVPDVLVHATLPVERVMKNLRSGGDALGPYDTEEFLQRLHQGYVEVARVLAKRHRTEVLECDPTTTSPQELADEIASLCERVHARPANAS